MENVYIVFRIERYRETYIATLKLYECHLANSGVYILFVASLHLILKFHPFSTYQLSWKELRALRASSLVVFLNSCCIKLWHMSRFCLRAYIVVVIAAV
jgi:hypothetical protein